jgi:hypothetical protein
VSEDGPEASPTVDDDLELTRWSVGNERKARRRRFIKRGVNGSMSWSPVIIRTSCKNTARYSYLVGQRLLFNILISFVVLECL